MPSYKLYYFDIRARGELARLLFAAAGVAFEDERISFEDWPKVKPTTPTGQLPYLTVDGKVLCQSHAIARYLAREFGLAGTGNWDQAQAEMVAESVSDMTQPLGVPALLFGTDEDKKNELRKAYEEDKLPGFLSHFEKLLTENGSDYFVGKEMTIADLAVFQGLDWIQTERIGIKVSLDKFPKLDGLITRIKTSSKVSDYIAKRPAAVL